MNRLVFVLGALIAAALMTESVSARDRYTTIRLTNNIGAHGQYNTKCVAIVETDILGVRKASADVVRWIIKNGNSHNGSDYCPRLDPSRVEIRFQEPVFGAEHLVLKAEQEMIGSKLYWVIKGTVDAAIQSGRYKYVVFYTKKVTSDPNDKDPAGPDPDVEVDCGGCFPP